MKPKRSRFAMGSEEYGVCDECGEYTEELVLMDGSWNCRACSQMS